MIQTFRLDDGRQTLVLAALAGEAAQVVYWGLALPPDEDLQTLARASQRDLTGGMLDAHPPLTLCPEAARSFPGQPGMALRGAGGAPRHPRLVFLHADEAPGRLALHHADAALGLRYVAHFEVCAQMHVITARAEIASEAPIRLDWLCAPALPAPDHGTDRIHFAGRWLSEFQPQHSPWSAGALLRESRAGRSDHSHFPALLLPGPRATNTQGRVHALHYGWSGGHRMLAEELPDGRRQVQFGHTQGAERDPATRFETAKLYLTVSDTGLNGAATAFQRFARDRLIPWTSEAPRKVHYNCWEAVYFDHDAATLRDIATRAAALGAERFVLDDGWFGRRCDDTTSLGDWYVDPRKYPNGLHPLIAHVQDLGMDFGLWFEPEMVNTASDLARAHPDWVLGPADQIEGRQQRVLDMANAAVRAHLYARIADILTEYPIAYIKWDHNRVLPMPDAAQTRGTHALLDQLRASFPQVEIESCASGGGRIDFGILARTQRVWLSDSNDALERLRIQHDAALFLPAAVTGSHVGPRHCHTSGRVLDIRFRTWVAAQRQMGFEMDPRELTEDEAAVLTRVTAWWKANRDWRMGADILRLDSPDPAVTAEIQLSGTKDRFVVFAAQTATSAQISPRPLPLTGLDPDARYEITLLNAGEAPGLARGACALRDGPQTLSGAYLMHHGLTLPWRFPETIWVVEGKRV